MGIQKCKNLKEAVIFLLDKSKQDGFSDRETANLLRDFLAELLAGKVGFSHKQIRYNPNEN